MIATAAPETPAEIEEVPRCPVCDQPGSIAYQDLPDRLFRTPGRWRFRRCDDVACGTFWIDPRPTLAAIGRFYESYVTHQPAGADVSPLAALVAAVRREYLAHHYGYRVGTLPTPFGQALSGLTRLLPGFRAAFDLEVRGLAPGPGQRLLDVCCGDGGDAAGLQQLGWDVEGVEVDPTAVQVARGRGLTVHQGTLEQQKFPEASFDVLTMSHVVEHLHHPQQVLRECLRVLRPGGSLVVATPNVRGMMHGKYRQHWLGLDPPRHLILFSQLSLSAVAVQAGFARVSTRSTVRNEDMLDFSSRLIRANGRYDWGDVPPLHARLRSTAVQFLAPIQIALGRAEGDEIFLVAHK